MTREWEFCPNGAIAYQPWALYWVSPTTHVRVQKGLGISSDVRPAKINAAFLQNANLPPTLSQGVALDG